MMNQYRTYGIELEFIGDRHAVMRAVNETGLQCRIEGYGHHTRSYWKITTDGSVRANPNQAGQGWEMVSPILRGQDGLEQIQKVCAAMKQVGASVNLTCGFHVHHDAQDFSADSFKNIVKIYKRFEPVMDSLVSNSRRGTNNQYCRTLRDVNLDVLLKQKTPQNIQAVYGTRYRKLNLQAFVTHGTIEFRQHQGTLDATKIINWIKLTQAIMERAVTRRVQKGTTADWDTFKYFLFLNPDPNNRVSSYDDETKEMLKFFNKRRQELAAA